MRRQLNTLYVTTEGAWLHKDGANIVMEVEQTVRARLPVHMLESLVCFGRVLVSPPLLGYCAEQGISTCFLTTNGRFLARVEGPVSGNVLLRRAQYRNADNREGCASIVRNLLQGKLHNQRAVLGRALRDHSSKLAAGDEAALAHAHQRLERIAGKLAQTPSVDLLRGYEGEAAQAYFGVFDHLIRVPGTAMRFTGRSRRPPLDAVNALLSFLYTLVTHDCRSALESVGLDPAVGFLHRDRPGRPSLALDLLEEFRPLLADRLALSLINLRQIGERDFQTMDNGAVLLREESRKTVLTAYQERKRETLRHVFLEEKAPIGLFPFIQAQLLARHLRGDLDAYPPFLWK
ncbi:type I-C CRISPR-associated endonuclease Cas1c [Acidovorax sp. SUPP2522]|uniref:type I-C CRISPR-associated endonuclease Cas1c n=1 Tax=unclassified Acidovorax TaxID=2684926 RepID=UPI002348EEE1|nr:MULTISPECIES: type I-C CRISPR-associated endonuclease Cas1c [unclassified Acidovorax]WCM96877.1 type I-C CRISPR-associated endonuclease Cas1c [Acidovorax sp. GBBC 1281]GKT14953.1 type I-C CRISPR-associated endonuclease Cas1c [Acidovorax sp. SUPP2522]